MVHAFKVDCAMVVMVVDSTEVVVGIWIVTKIDGMEVEIVSKAL